MLRGASRMGRIWSQSRLHTSALTCKAPQASFDARVAALHRRVLHEAQRGHPQGLAETCRDVCKLVQQHEAVPSVRALQQQTYELILRVLAERGLSDDAMRVLDDMDASAVPLTPVAHEWLIQAAVNDENIPNMTVLFRRAAETAPSKTDRPEVMALSPWTPNAYRMALAYCAKTGNMELALLLWFTAADYHIVLDDDALRWFVECASQACEPRLAYEVAQASGTADTHVWITVLRVAAQCDYAPALDEAWAKSLVLLPDEGLFLQVMVVAARTGNDKLVDAMLQAFSILYPHAQLETWHLALALEAYCRTGRLNDVLAIVDRLRPTLDASTLAPLTTYAASSDTALHETVRTVLAQPTVPLLVVHALLYAAAERASMPVALLLWEAGVQGRFVPDLDTHTAFLMCCIAAADRAAGERVWPSLARHNLAPTPALYERMVRLHLTQSEYEEAFALLERIKEHGCIPSRRTYAAMVWTCLHYKDPRWETLLQEMQEAAYEPGGRLREVLEAHQMTSTTR